MPIRWGSCHVLLLPTIQNISTLPLIIISPLNMQRSTLWRSYPRESISQHGLILSWLISMHYFVRSSIIQQKSKMIWVITMSSVSTKGVCVQEVSKYQKWWHGDIWVPIPNISQIYLGFPLAPALPWLYPLSICQGSLKFPHCSLLET